MWAQAMYVGKRKYKREEGTTEEGEVIPAKKGMQYLFYTGEWNGELIDGMGRTRFETVDEKEVEEYEKKLPSVGGFCQIQVRESWGKDPNNLCKFVKAEQQG